MHHLPHIHTTHEAYKTRIFTEKIREILRYIAYGQDKIGSILSKQLPVLLPKHF